jgi:hypothetical protein
MFADFMITEKQGCGLPVVGRANERDRLTQPESSMGAPIVNKRRTLALTHF